MPTYAYECPECGAQRDGIASVAERHISAPLCHSRMRLVIAPPMVMGDIPPYTAMAGDMAGKTVSGRKEHREFLKRNRLVEVGNEPMRAIKNDFRPRPGEIRSELARVVPEVRARYRG